MKMNKKENLSIKEEKGLKIFLSLTFLLTFLLGLVMYFAKMKNLELGRLAIGQMMLPAFAGMVTSLKLIDKKADITRKSYYLYLAFTLVYLAYMIITIFFVKLSQDKLSLIDNSLLMFASIIFIIFINIEGKKKKLKSNLNFGPLKKVLLVVLIFLGLFYLRSFILSYISKDMESFKLAFRPDKQGLFFIILLNFVFVFIPFLGEEYGWRFFLQPLLQKKYGMRKGLIVLGLIWGLWHLPLCLFFYSANGTGFLSLINQIIVCISLGIFFAYAYSKSGSIWAVTIIHYLNNNMILMFTESLDPNVIAGQDFNLMSILLTALVMVICYLPFIFTKYCSDKTYRSPSFYERIESFTKEDSDEKI